MQRKIFTHKVVAYVTAEEYARLKGLREARSISISALVRRLLLGWAKEQEAGE